MPVSRGEVDEEHSVGEPVGERSGTFDREPRLADSAGARQRQEADVAPEEVDDLLDLARASDEGGRRSGEMATRTQLG